MLPYYITHIMQHIFCSGSQILIHDFWHRIAGFCIWIFTFANILGVLILIVFRNGALHFRIMLTWKLLPLIKEEIISAIRKIIYLWFLINDTILSPCLCRHRKTTTSHGWGTKTKSWFKNFRYMVLHWKKRINANMLLSAQKSDHQNLQSNSNSEFIESEEQIDGKGGKFGCETKVKPIYF